MKSPFSLPRYRFAGIARSPSFDAGVAGEHLIRGAVIEIHLIVEDTLNKIVRSHILGKRSFRSNAAVVLEPVLIGGRSMRFMQKAAIAPAGKWITEKEYRQLEKLNAVRNQCSHTWRLREGDSIYRQNKPVLRYEGKNLYLTGHFIDFMAFIDAMWKRMIRRNPHVDWRP